MPALIIKTFLPPFCAQAVFPYALSLKRRIFMFWYHVCLLPMHGYLYEDITGNSYAS
jgi:hypothetical protein